MAPATIEARLPSAAPTMFPAPPAPAPFLPLANSVGDLPDIPTQIAADQLHSVAEATSQPILAGLLFALLLGVMMWPLAPQGLVAGWVAFKLLAGLLRLGWVAAYRRDPLRAQRAPHWARRYVAIMLPDTLSWSAAPILFMPFCTYAGALLLMAGAVGVTAVGVFTVYFHARIGLAYLLGMLVPLGLDQWLHHGPVGRITALALGIYVAVMALEVRRGERRVIETLRLRYENASIAEERRRALVMAEHSSATKTRFLAAVSHELRTPLNGILGMTELMSGGTSDPVMLQRLGVVQQSARHLQTVIGDLLDLSRIEFGRLELDEQVYAPAEMLHAVTDLLAAVADERKLGFRIEMQPTLPPWVRGSPSRVKQVLHNLLGNALKFTHRGEVRMRAGWVDGLLSIEVADTGPGIAPEHIERMFDAFAQGAGAGDQRRAGTGLGLTISRQMARAMGGDVVCTSTVGLGASFHFTARAPLIEPAAAPRLDSAGAISVRPRLVGHLLVVDDNPVNALVATSVLELFGLTSDVAEDGEQALALLGQRSYAAVLMDCLMPRLDGLETTRRWRAVEQAGGRARLPIIALTANAAPGERERCLQAGMDDFITKPYEQKQLAAVLQRHLPRHAAQPG